MSAKMSTLRWLLCKWHHTHFTKGMLASKRRGKGIMRNARLYKFHSAPTREEGREGAPRTTVSGKWRPEKKGVRWENGAKSGKEGR